MLLTPTPSAVSSLLAATMDRRDAAYVSAGTAVASFKELTLSLPSAWAKRHDPNYVDPWSDWDDKGRLKVLLGTALGQILNPEEERRVEIETPYGLVSGRIDLIEMEEGSGNPTTGGFTPLPCEIKLSWAFDRRVSPQYVEQLACYMLALGVTHGRLYLFWATKPLPESYDLFLSDSELEAWREELHRRLAMVLDPDQRPPPSEAYGWEGGTRVEGFFGR